MIYNAGKIRIQGMDEQFTMDGLEMDNQMKIAAIMEKHAIDEWSLEELNQPSATLAARVRFRVHEKHAVNAPLAAKQIQEEIPPAYVKAEVFVELVPNDKPIFEEQ